MTKLHVLIAGAVCLPAALAVAQTDYHSDTHTDYNHPDNNPEEIFHANEASIDLFGSVSIGQQTINHISGDHVRDDGRLGAGIGLNYFITRNIGVGGDAYTENTAHNFVDNASGNLIFRIPIDKAHLAPYVFGGGGYQFDPNEVWFGQVGVGLEVRLTHNLSFIVDARYVMPEQIDNYGVGRAGLRISL
jgi:hypothetical protein